MILPLTTLFLVSLFAQDSTPVIIDTDAGVDDYMAIAFLLSRDDVHIAAVSVVNGLAHVDAGARNVARLLELGGQGGVPIYLGRGSPMFGNAAFPDEWRKIADNLPGVWPPANRPPETAGAADYLVKRLRDPSHPARILALGPLTNLAEALQRSPRIAKSITEIVMMGGAVRTRGNVDDGGYFKTDNTTAEWNMFVDPAAAKIVFASGIPIRLIPLDATNKVPIDVKFLDELRSSARTPLARFVAQILESERDIVKQGFYYAWDPLAAVVLVDRRVVSLTPLHLEIRLLAPEAGRTAEAPGKPNTGVALDASAAKFQAIFLGALSQSPHKN